MKDVKRIIPKFNFYDAHKIEQTLTEQAAQGWMVEKPSNFFWIFRRIEPVNRRFAVVYDPSASQFDPRPTEAQLTRDEFCAVDGWQIALRWDSMQIYFTDDLEAVPVETEPFTQSESMIRTMKNKAIAPHLLLLALGLLQLWMHFKSFLRDPADFLSSVSSLVLTLLWLTWVLEEAYITGFGLLWCHRARKAAERQEFYPLHTQNFVFYLLLAIDIPLVLYLWFGSGLPVINTVLMVVGFAAVAVLGRLIQNRLKKRGTPRNLNRAVSMSTVGLGIVGVMILVTVLMFSGLLHTGREGKPVGSYENHGAVLDIYNDPLPLSLDDFGPVEFPDNRRAQIQQSPLLTYGEYTHQPLYTAENFRDLPDISYTVADTRYSFVEGLLHRHMLTLDENDIAIFGMSLRPMEIPENFPAQEVWQYYYDSEPSQKFLLFYEGGRMVEIRFSYEVHDLNHMLTIAAQKLTPQSPGVV